MKKLSAFEQLMIAFLGFLLALLLCRIVYSNSYAYLFLLWNLFLGWLPYWFSKKTISSSGNWVKWIWAAAWLLFFPNALYIFTDLIHLENISGAPVWFDALVVLTAAIIGMMMAFASLLKIEQFIKIAVDRKLANITIVGLLFIGSFGVYLGRFLRWNSWDIITNPLGLCKQIAQQFYRPFDNYKTWVITVLFTCFFSLLYFTVKRLPHLLPEMRKNKE